MIEKKLEASWQHRSIYAFEEKNTRLVRQYASAYVKDFNLAMNGMVERRLQQSILATASLWFTAWVNAGQPDLTGCSLKSMDPEDEAALQRLNNAWRTMKAIGRPEPAE